MTKTKTHTPAIDQFYDYCWSNSKLTEEDVDTILVLAAVNNDEVTDSMLRGYLPLAWAACVHIAQAMHDLGIAKYTDQLSGLLVHLPEQHQQGVWKIPSELVA